MSPPESNAPHAPHVALPHAHAADDHGHGHGSRFIQHHYDDGQHQFDAGKLGIWLFLAQEVLFFSALFVAYILYRHHHPEIFAYAHHYLNVKYGAINTAVLIFSSLTAAWAVRAAQLGQRKLLIGCLTVTIACACVFLGIKYIEYTTKIREHVLFGNRYDPCVSSGGSELITKLNECEGTKSTVKWDFGTAQPKPGSCFGPESDQDLTTAGVQLDCAVSEVKQHITGTHYEDAPELARLKQDLAVATEPSATKMIKDQIAKLPPTPADTNVVKETGRRTIPACVDKGDDGDEEARFEIHPKSYPCWIANYQPAVCKAGDGVLVLYGDEEERGAEVESKSTNGNATVTETNNLEVDADCKKAPPAKPPADPLADKEQKLVAGATTVDTHVRELTNHEKGLQLAAGPPPEHTSMFFTIYFAMTGLHGIHVLVGIGVFIWLLIRAIRGDFTPDYFGPIDYAALYWHIVDLIWIFLFPLLYLIH